MRTYNGLLGTWKFSFILIPENFGSLSVCIGKKYAKSGKKNHFWHVMCVVRDYIGREMQIPPERPAEKRHEHFRVQVPNP